MIIPVVYTDSLNIDALSKALGDAIASLKQGATTGAAVPDAGVSTHAGH